MNTESNGPANIIMILDFMLENNEITADKHAKLVATAHRTIKYIRLLDNTNNVRWADVE